MYNIYYLINFYLKEKILFIIFKEIKLNYFIFYNNNINKIL